MTLRHTPLLRSFLIAPLALGLALSGCLEGDDGGNDDSTFAYANLALTADDEADDGFDESTDTSALEEELEGAFDEDEAPTADELDPEGTTDTPEVDLPEDMLVRRVVRVLWGQPVLNPEAEAREWKGQLRTTNGIVRPLRKVRFEAGDRLIRDEDPQAVTFSTLTKPHNDGILALIVVPKSKVADAELSFVTQDGVELSTSLANVLDGIHEVSQVDDAGNMVRIDTAPEHPCQHGLLRARWKRVNEKGGVFGGGIINSDGELIGHIMGLWGKVDGKRRFKGVYRNLEGEFRGTIRGAWRPFPAKRGVEGGVFRGHWRRADGEVEGVMGGVYHVGDTPGQGGFVGHWRARCADGPSADCAPERALPSGDAPVCSCESASSASGEGCTCTAYPPQTCLDADGNASTDRDPSAAGE